MKNRQKIKGYKLQVTSWTLTALICFFYCPSFSQEVLTDLTVNPVLLNRQHALKAAKHQQPISVFDTLSLPFLDDFSKDDIYPDAGLWKDSSVFINRDYPIAPPTLGAATFDGVSKSGSPYDTNLTNNTASLPADFLTSKSLNLSGLPVDSTVILTFFYQAEGRGNDPEQSDSLLLDFFNPTTQKWKNIWYKRGYNPTTSDTIFRLVTIPIADTAYLKNAFQFRFRNRATVSGNVDHWHIDYVFLDKNRNMGDTIFSDVAFVYNSRSLLTNYYAMPWRQYQPSEMKSNLSFFVRNNDNIPKNTSFDYKIYNNTAGTEATYTGGSDNCDPFITNGYWNNPAMSNPPIGTNVPGPALTPYTYPALADSASFTLECVLKTTPDKDRWNDTLRFQQNFHNYFAYDDGTVEGGYGLSGQNAYGGQMAYKFTLNTADTLVALQMLFNWIPPNVNQRQFKIRVWNDAGGLPGTLIYEDDYVTPNYQYVYHNTWGNLTNVFYPYILTTKQPLPSGTFYVGLIQYCCLTSGELLNIGYDKNTNSTNKMFFNIGSGWNQTAILQKGSWMIRPVFGTTSGLLGIHKQSNETDFNIFPNPSDGTFSIQSSNIKTKSIEIYNLRGNRIYESFGQALPTTLDISYMSDGIYLLRIMDEKGEVHSHKLILTK